MEQLFSISLAFEYYILGGVQERLPFGSVVKNTPAMQETQAMCVWSRGQEDPLEEGMATHSSILARKITWTEKPGGLWSMGVQRVRHNWNDWA